MVRIAPPLLAAALLAGLGMAPAAADPWRLGARLGLELVAPLHQTDKVDSIARLGFGLTGNGAVAPEVELSFDLEAWYDGQIHDFDFNPGEAKLVWSPAPFEVALGYDIENWSVTEASELNNIVNQTDLNRDLSGNTRLGQPMLRLSYFGNAGRLSGYFFPHRPERPFAPVFGFDRAAAVYDTKRGAYEPGYALRYQHSFGTVDLDLFTYYGVDNTPFFRLVGGQAQLLYPKVRLSGISTQAVLGPTFLRLELQHVVGRPDRDGLRRSSLSHSIELEHELYGVFGTGADLALLAAHSGSSLGRKSTELFQNDISLGAKLTLNDVGSTEATLLATHDLDHGSTFLSLAIKRRIGDTLKLELEAVDFLNVDANDPVAPLRDAGQVRLLLTRYF